MIFADVVTPGIDRIYEEDLEAQMHMMRTALDITRGRSDLAPLIEAKAFFVPNEGYMRKFFGDLCVDPQYDIYDYNGLCNWTNFIVMPITDLANQIVGFVGYDVVGKINVIDKVITDADYGKYRYSSSTVFKRSHYIFMLPGVYQKALKDGYIILMDGNFDMLYLHHEGYNTASLLGSNVTPEILFLLSFIENIYVAEDMDVAGRQLYEKIQMNRPDVKYIRKNADWDVDEVLKSSRSQEFISLVDKAITQRLSVAKRHKPWKINLG